MTKDVMVTITGLHTMDEDDDAIEVVHIGEHYERNGAHYILFEERMEGMSAPVKNRIKIKDRCMEVQKKGAVNAAMIFEEAKSQSCTYAIPYGSFLLETYTTSVTVIEEEERLEATAVYELRVNGIHCAKSAIRVIIQPKELFRL